LTEEKDHTPTKRPHVTKNDTGQHLGWHKIRRHLLLRSQENTDRNTPKRCEKSSEEYPRFSRMTPHNCPIRRPLSSEASRHRDGWRQSTRTSCHLPIALPAARRPPHAVEDAAASADKLPAASRSGKRILTQHAARFLFDSLCSYNKPGTFKFVFVLFSYPLNLCIHLYSRSFINAADLNLS
jgi:hypothetical protein